MQREQPAHVLLFGRVMKFARTHGNFQTIHLLHTSVFRNKI